jgi:hypothetical protein
MSFSTIFFITILMLAFVFAAIGVKIVLKKDGEFSGTCASQSPFLNKEGESCSLCGAQPDEKCNNENS